jgi:hypothetical protein
MILLIFLYRCIISALFLLGSIRTNLPFVCAFFGLVFLFGFISAANFQLGFATTATEAEYSLTLLKFAGGFGFFTALAGWLVSLHLQHYMPCIIKCRVTPRQAYNLTNNNRYLAIITVCASTQIPCPLPIGDLSSRVFPRRPISEGLRNSEV